MQALPHSVPRPCSRPPLTHVSARDSWTLTGKCGSVSCGHCSWILDPGVHKVLFAPCKSLLPQSCVNSGSSMVGLMVTSSKRAYTIPTSAAPSPLLLQQATADLYFLRRHLNTQGRSGSVSCGLLVHTRFYLSPWSTSDGYGVCF